MVLEAAIQTPSRLLRPLLFRLLLKLPGKVWLSLFYLS